MSAKTAATEFSISEFDTSVTDQDEKSVINAINNSIENLLEHIDPADLERILRSNKVKDKLKKEDTGQRKPEDLTQQKIIEPLLESLGYTNYTKEVSGFAPNSKQEADYEFPLHNVDEVKSNRLLLEAEPINKPLDTKGHGINQVKSWLRLKDFEAEYGIVTDGVKWVLIQRDPDSHAYNTISEVDLQPVFLSLFANHLSEQKPAKEALADVDIERVSAFINGFAKTNFIAIASNAREIIKKKQEQITDEFYDEYVQYVFGVTKDGDPAERNIHSLIGSGIRSPDHVNGNHTRLFAVNLMNRLIFIKFLEDKEIVKPDTLTEFKKTYDKGVYPETFYKTFIEKLFFDVLNNKPPRKKEIKNINLFNDIPYLNGGLFDDKLTTIETETNKGDTEEKEETELSAKEFNVNDKALFQIIEFLESYTFSVGGGPTDMDPSVLGNVFEKTVTYLTTDAGDKNAELGAYYTPKEITRFSVEQTIYPALKDRFCDYMIQEWGWTETQAEQYETYREVINAIPRDKNIIEGLLEEVDELSVLDPAAGSGHFLKAALEELRNVREELHLYLGDDVPAYKIMKRTVQNNIYGVEILGPAMEIGKLRLWLNIVKELDAEEAKSFNSKELALPNVTFNLRVGNSLIGLNRLLEKTNDDENGEQRTFEPWTSESVGEKYKDVIEQIKLHEEHNHDPKKAKNHRRKAEYLIREYKPELDEKIYNEFKDFTDGLTNDDLEEFDRFHWILEFASVYSEGGFDVIIGNPPWDMLTPDRNEYFNRSDEEFSKMLPKQKDERQQELLQDEEIRKGWEEYQNEIEVVTNYFHQSETYNLQKPVVGGTAKGTENDLSALFLERVYDLARDDAYVSQVLPGNIFNGASSKDLRMHLLDETRVDSLVTFENQGIFKEIHQQYKFGVVVFETGSATDELNGIFHQTELDVLEDVENNTLDIPREVLSKYSPEARIFPNLQSQLEVEIIRKIVEHPPIGEDKTGHWKAKPYAELHRTSDSDRFVEQKSQGDYPVYGGSNIYQYNHDNTFHDINSPEFWSVESTKDPQKSGKQRTREKQVRNLKRAIYDAFDGSGSQVSFVNELLEDHRGEPLSEDDVLLDCTEYRIAYRDITNATNERTMVATVIPPNVVCHHTINTIRPYDFEPQENNLEDDPLHSVYERIFTDRELFVAVGLINSIPFDFLMRTKVDTHIVMYKFKESQVPRLTEGDEWFEYISGRAARLNCYGDTFEEMRDRLGGIEPATKEDKRRELQAEIDAAAFHAYGLERDETKFILDDFHRVQNPRVMTDEYFDLVLQKYDELDDIGLLP